jgi:hypothetical protein
MKLLAAAALWPGWLRRAFSDVTVRGEVPARIHGPTLVLVLPQKDELKYERGTAFGELLNYGSDRDLAPLALANVVCLSATQLPIPVAGDPLMVFDDGDKQQILDGKLPKLVYPRNEFDWDRPEPEVVQATERRMALLAGLIQRALGPYRAADKRSDATLAALARARYVKRPPPGTHWANGGTCGITVENAPELSENVDCGMGHVPYRSGRFLYFYTRRL